jgi:outer membrane protein
VNMWPATIRHWNYLGIALLLGACMGAASAESYTLSSFDEALRIGIARNLRLQESEKRVAEARQALLRSRALFMPRAQLTSGYSVRDAAFTIPSYLMKDAPKDPGIFTGYKNDWSMRLQVDQTLFAGGRNYYTHQIAEKDTAVQEENLKLRRLNLEVEITRAYYAVILAQQVVQIKQDLIDQSKRHQTEVSRRFQAGDASRFDRLRAMVQVANLQPELIRARNSVELASAQLKNVLGLDQNDTLTVTGRIEYIPEKTELPTALRQALEKRPEIHASRLVREIQEGVVKVSRARFFPVLGAFFSQDFRSDHVDSMFGSRHRNWTVGFNMSLPLFEGGSRFYQQREDRLKADQARLREEQAGRDVQVEVIQASLELQRAAEVIESQRQTVEQAEEAFKIANISYANGVLTNLEQMDTQLALDQARINYITAIYDYMVGRAAYRKAIAEHY